MKQTKTPPHNMFSSSNLNTFPLLFIGQTAPRQPTQMTGELIIHKQEKEEIDDDEEDVDQADVIISGL